MPDPVARHAKHRREQRPEILQRPEQRQRQYRAGLDQDVPAEHEVLHLDAPGGQEIGRPLKAEAAHPERRQHRGGGEQGHAVYEAVAWVLGPKTSWPGLTRPSTKGEPVDPRVKPGDDEWESRSNLIEGALGSYCVEQLIADFWSDVRTMRGG